MIYIHTHEDLMENTVFLISCNFFLQYLNIHETTPSHHVKENEHGNFSHAYFSISFISSEDTHNDNIENTLRNIQKVFADFCSKYNDKNKSSLASVPNVISTQADDLFDNISLHLPTNTSSVTIDDFIDENLPHNHPTSPCQISHPIR